MITIIIIAIIYVIGGILTYARLQKDLASDAAIIFSLFSWVTLILLGIGELANWYWNEKKSQ